MERIQELIRYFASNIGLLPQLDAKGLRDVTGVAVIAVQSEGYPEAVKKDAYELLCRVAMERKLLLEERWSIYWLLSTKIFVSTDYDQYDRVLDEIYADIYRDLEQRLPEELLKGKMEGEGNGPIVIVTSQFLSLGHAPTRRVLDYAYTLNKVLGIPVKIINEAGMHIKKSPYMPGMVFFNFIEDYSRLNRFSYKDAVFDFFQAGAPMPDVQEIANIVYNIKQLAPRLVLNVGASCLTSDLCRGFAKTATIPCSTSIPRTMAEYPVLCRKLRDTDKEKAGRLQPYQHIVESVFNYIMPDDRELTKYTREQLGIPADAWLLVSAGNRMGLELDRDFMAMADEVLGRIPDAHFLIIGDVDAPARARITAGLMHTDRIHFAGRLADGSQAVRLGNVYIQPTRKGGGRAAFEALYYGVPVITTPYGDTWDVCGETFEAESYEEMAGRIEVYKNDRELYNAYQEAAKDRAAYLEDMDGMFRNLLKDLGVAVAGDGDGVDQAKFYNIFDIKESADEEIKKDLAVIKTMLARQKLQSQETEWAAIFADTIRGSEWFKDVPLSPGRYAIGYPGLYSLYRVLDEFHPQNILEIGLGQSTKMIGKYAEYYGANHTIVEHDRSWIDFFLDKHGKGERTNMVCLERLEGEYRGRYIDTAGPVKYYKDFAKNLGGQKFDLIFIDGPQGSGKYSRVDITEILPECLAESFVIMVDDSQRPGEKNTIGCICEILTCAGIVRTVGIVEGMKDTSLIVSKDLEFLTSL